MPPQHDATDPSLTRTSENAYLLGIGGLGTGDRAELSEASTEVNTLKQLMSEERCDLLCIDAPRAGAICEELLGVEAARVAAERARALSDPTRLMLAAALREGGELCVCDLAWISGRAQNLVSHHLRLLRSHGLVRSRRDGKLVMYSLTGEGSGLLGAVLGDEAGVVP